MYTQVYINVEIITFSFHLIESFNYIHPVLVTNLNDYILQD